MRNKLLGSFLWTLSIFTISLLGACKKDTDNAKIAGEDGNFIKDQYGRTLILHGLNTSSSAKYGNYHPWIEEADVEREDKEFGFNFVRYLTSWVAIEPEKGVYDENYLNELQKRVEWYTSRGMYVMIDMHQDIYGAAVGGNGAPAWACITDGMEPIEITDGIPWWVKNIDPAAIAAWKNFWEYKNYKWLQDHYILAWQKVAQRFKDNPYVIGYDLMNEPWGGDLLRTFITGEFEKTDLTNLYKRLIPAIRAVDTEKYIFFESLPAPVTFGEPTNLRDVKDTRTPSRLVFAPHCYPYDTHEGLGYSTKSKSQLKSWETERKKDTKLYGKIPLLTGEFGLSPSQAGFAEYLNDFNNMSDRNLWHWTYWSNDLGGWSPLNADRSETAILQHLVRAYPKATAGTLKSFSYNAQTKTFTMTYINDKSISEPTEIFIPKRYFTNGYNIESSSEITQEWNAAKQLLLIRSNENTEITLTITPK